MHNRFFDFRSGISINRLIPLLLLLNCVLYSCQKGELDKATTVSSVNIIMKTANTGDLYHVFLNGKALGDTLDGDDRLSEMVEAKQDPVRLEVRELNGNVFFDTTMVLPTPQLSFLLFQSNAGEKPLAINNQDEEPLPGTDSVKWRFIYADQTLPDVIKLRYYYVNAVDLSAEVFDSVTIQRGQTSRYTTASLKKYSSNPEDAYWAIEIENAATNSIIQKLELDPASPRFLEGLLFEVRTSFGLSAKKQTQLLNFGTSGSLSDTYFGSFLIGSN